MEEFLELDFGDGGVNVAVCVEVFRVEAADCPCGLSGGVVYVALCFHRLPAVGAEPVVFHWLFFLSESECDAAWHRAAVKKPRVKPVKRQMMAISMRSPVSLDGFCDEADRDDQQNP